MLVTIARIGGRAQRGVSARPSASITVSYIISNVNSLGSTSMHWNPDHRDHLSAISASVARRISSDATMVRTPLSQPTLQSPDGC